MSDECVVCGEPSQTMLDLEGEEIPACYDHASEVVDNREKYTEGDSGDGPDLKLQSGSVHLDVWRNEDGPDSYSFKRFYTDDDGENFTETTNMRPRDLPHMVNLIRKMMQEKVQEK